LPFSARNQRQGFVEAILNMLLAGTFDFIDFLIVPHTRKAIQALYRELALVGQAHPELPLPRVEFFDRAYTPFYASEVFNRLRFLELKARLEEWSGRTITTDALAGAITRSPAAVRDRRVMRRHGGGGRPLLGQPPG
jgi:hypothetical protein